MIKIKLETELDMKIIETKKLLNDLYKTKKLEREYIRLQSKVYRPPIHHIVSNWIDAVCLTFEKMVKKE